MKKGVIILTLLLFGFSLLAQEDQDTLVPPILTSHLHSPKKAAIYSAILPGAGQFYNKKYWKIPVVYAGLGVGAYSIAYNTTKYKFYRQNYKYKVKGRVVDPSLALMSTSIMKANRDSYRRTLEISYLITGLWYAINILDATVDGHLFDFNVGEDLSMRVDPFVGRQYGQNTFHGVGVKLCFK